MKKRVFCFLAALVLMLALFPASVYAQSALTGKCGDQGSEIVWTVSYDGTLTISGKGTMKYFGETVAGWHKFGKAIKTVIVGEGVTNIGGYAFWECPNITSVTLPSTLTSIDRFAFIDCAQLESIDIPTGVQTIDMGAFYGCASLDRVVLPDTVGTLGTFAFANCIGLTAAVVPNSIISIGTNVFLNCADLTIYGIKSSMIEIYAKKNNIKLIYADAHKMTHFAKIPATCTTAGTIEYWHCSDCNKNFSDSLGIKAVTDLTIPAIPTAHKFSGGKCVYCGKEGKPESDQSGIIGGSGSTQGFPFPPVPGMGESSGWSYEEGGYEWSYYWGYITGRAEGNSAAGDGKSPEDSNSLDSPSSGGDNNPSNITNNYYDQDNYYDEDHYHEGDNYYDIVVSDPVEPCIVDVE